MQPPLSHFTSPDFWSLYKRLPAHVQRTADKYFNLLKSDPNHPSLHLKKIGAAWSVRAGLHYRAVGMDAPSEERGILWGLDRVTRRVRPIQQRKMREQLNPDYCRIRTNVSSGPFE